MPKKDVKKTSATCSHPKGPLPKRPQTGSQGAEEEAFGEDDGEIEEADGGEYGGGYGGGGDDYGGGGGYGGDEYGGDEYGGGGGEDSTRLPRVAYASSGVVPPPNAQREILPRHEKRKRGLSAFSRVLGRFKSLDDRVCVLRRPAYELIDDLAGVQAFIDADPLEPAVIGFFDEERDAERAAGATFVGGVKKRKMVETRQRMTRSCSNALVWSARSQNTIRSPNRPARRLEMVAGVSRRATVEKVRWILRVGETRPLERDGSNALVLSVRSQNSLQHSLVSGSLE